MKTKKEATITAANEMQCKNTKYLADYKKVFEYFSLKPATMFQCETDTGIPRPYVCWYVRSLRKNEDIQIFKFGRCPISKYKDVQFLTTDRNLFKPEIKQSSLFDELWP
ncbi:MAG: hypothetical protein LBG17_05925 [Bacteroidales bacterium]|jgi:hypothetical protein|nr:hypothetical protein [Bacteroidales bacterium]